MNKDVKIRVNKSGSNFKVTVDPWLVDLSKVNNDTIVFTCNIPFVVEFDDPNTLLNQFGLAGGWISGAKLASLGGKYGPQKNGYYHCEAAVNPNAVEGIFKYTVTAVPDGNIVVTIDPDYRITP